MKNYPDLSNVRKILVIKLRHHGDVLLASPVFSALKKQFPKVEIDAYVYKETLPMLDGHPAISEFILYDKKWKKGSIWKSLKNEWKILKSIRRKKYDLVINLTEGDRGAIVCYFSKARYRVGFDPENSGMWQKKRCYTQVTRICHHPRHTVEKNLDVVRTIGIFPPVEERGLTLQIPEEAKNKISLLLELEEINAGEYIVIHPVSRWLFKCWPEKKFAELIQLLHMRGKKVVLTSGPDPEEMAIVSRIMEIIPDIPVCNLAGKTTLKELAAVIEMSSLLITVDSVSLHIASAVKAPVVAIFGPTSEVNWAPWQHPNSRVVNSDISCRPCYMPGCGGSRKSDCLEALPVSHVYAALEELLVLQPKVFTKV